MAAAALPKTGSTPGRKTDPLVLLKDHVVNNKKVHYENDILEFGDIRVHRGAKCGFRLSPKEPLCDIGSIWYMFRETSADRSYTQDTAKKRGFKYIGVATRGDLCEYLMGRVMMCDGLVKEVIEGRKRPREDVEVEQKKAARAVPKPGDPLCTGPIVSAEEVGKEITYHDVQERVRPVQDLDVLVRCPGRTVPNADIILKIAQDEWNNWHKLRKQQEQTSVDSLPPFRLELEDNIKKSPDNNPIILVPCNKNAPVNLLNVQDLLQHGIYKKPDEEKVRFFESTRPEFVHVTRNVGNNIWTFEIRDSAKNFNKAQWLRTVCIVTDSSDWQFKGYPFEDVVDMFTTIRGIYFQAPGTLVPLHVEKWSVAVLPLAAMQLEHRFAQTRDKFFTVIEEFINGYRQRKFVNHKQLEGGRKILAKPLPIL